MKPIDVAPGAQLMEGSWVATALVQPGLDIVIVNYRTPDDLRDCLSSLAEYEPTYPYDVWVVNVDPTPEDLEVTELWLGSTHWRSITFTDNVGYNQAVNYAGGRGDREVIASFNADVVFTEGVIDATFEALVAAPDWAIAGPRQVDDHGRITAAGIFDDASGRPRHRGWHATGPVHTDIRDDCATVSGAAYFIKREVWDGIMRCPVYQDHFPDAVGPMSDCQHFYGDEICAWAARAHGYKLGYVGTVTMIHKLHGAGQPDKSWTAPDRAKLVAFTQALPVSDPCMAAHG